MSFWGLPGGSVVKNPPANAEDARDMGSIPGSGKIPRNGKWQPTSVFLVGKFYGQRSLWATQMGSQRVAHDWATHTHSWFTGFPGGLVGKQSACYVGEQEMWVQSSGWEDPLEEGMATHSSNLAWRISWTEELGGLQSTGSQRVEHYWSNWVHMNTRHRVDLQCCVSFRYTAKWVSYIYIFFCS